MVTDASDSTGERGESPEWSAQLDRLSELVETLLEELTRLGEENRRLRQAVRQAGQGKAAGGDTAKLLKQLESERQTWERQRQAITDRIEVILGKFHWLEAERNARSTTLTEV